MADYIENRCRMNVWCDIGFVIKQLENPGEKEFNFGIQFSAPVGENM